MKKAKNVLLTLLSDERGAFAMSAFPGVMVICFTLFVLVINVMLWDVQINELQIMADRMSRAGACAVSKTYAVRERTGHGFGDYHVYNELFSRKFYDEQGTAKRSADENANIVFEEFQNYTRNRGIEVDEASLTYNPVGDEFINAEWSAAEFKYVNKPNMLAKQQYKNGNFSCVFKASISGVWTNVIGLGVGRKLDVWTYSQSMVHGTVTGNK